MAEGLDGQRRAEAQRDLAVLVERRQHRVVAAGDVTIATRRVVLRRRADHRRTADVDLLDELVERQCPGRSAAAANG